jgi:flagellar motor switch protein FliN/FliY
MLSQEEIDALARGQLPDDEPPAAAAPAAPSPSPSAAARPKPAAPGRPKPAAAAPAAPAPSLQVNPAQFTPLSGEDAGGDAAKLDLLLDVVLQVSVELGRTRLTIGDILALRAGSVIELDKLAGEPVDILVNGTRIARGEVVVVDEKFGVRVLEVVSRAKRLASMA